MEDGTERHVLRPLPSLDFKVLKEDGLEAEPGECGELYLSFFSFTFNSIFVTFFYCKSLNGRMDKSLKS